MALVLAIEPDLRQAGILTRIVREKVKADVVIVDSRDAALEAMRTAVPDVMLLSALLSPRDEDELVAHLRALEGAEHLQTHTIPQLASSGADGDSGPARGLLKAFRRRKEGPRTVAGCDPDLFAQEIRVFLEQAEQKRRERAEELQYRPATSTVRPPAAETKPTQEPADIPAAATTSWDSPFEWRKADTGPAPLASFQEEPAPMPPPFEPPPEPAAEAEFDWSAHLLDPSSALRDDVAPDPVPGAVTEPTVATDHLLEANGEASEPESLIPAEVMRSVETHSEFVQPQPLASVEASDFPEVVPSPEVAPLDTQWDAPAELQAATESHASPPHVVPRQPDFPDVWQAEPLVETPVPSAEEVDAPELFETFVPPPVPQWEAAAVPAATGAEAQAEPVDEPVADPIAPGRGIPTPEEIEAYGRIELPEITFSTTPPAAPALDERPLSIEYFVEADAAPEVAPPASAIPAAIAAEATRESAEEEEIDLDWALDDAPIETVTAAPVDAFHSTEGADASEFLSADLVDDETDAQLVAVADAEQAHAVKKPVNLGPLATWARLESRPDDERRPGSDMRDIIERLAVPPHIAGVSYARGVRIRRVRVAGTRDRRRPADQSGPVILSRRALAESRSVGPA